MSLELTEPPALEPVSLAGMKARLRITHNDQDDRIRAVISASRQRVEAECGLALIEQGWLERRDSWHQGGRLSAFGTRFRLGLGPVIAVDSIAVIASDGTTEAWADSGWKLVRETRSAWLLTRPAGSFPTIGRPANGLEIRFRAGFGADPETVPADLREAVARLAEYLLGEPSGERAEQTLPPAVSLLLAPWRRAAL